MIKYVIKIGDSYVTNHRRGRRTKHLESAKTFKTYHAATTNRWAKTGGQLTKILPVEFEISISPYG